MGLMNKLRDRTHIILIVLVIAFLATIIFEWGMNYLSTGSSTTFPLGSVNGVEINYQDFEARVQMTIDQQKQQTGQDPDEAMMQMIRDQVWDQMVTEMIAKEQIEKLGIQVTDQEVVDWVYKSPETLPDPIKRNFIDSTGQFNMALYQQVLQTKTPEIQNFWNQVETYLKQVLLSQKLQSVITGVVRVPETDIKQQFVDENISADINYLFLDVNSITDESIQISEDDLKKFYDKNKEDFRIEESAKLKYILFSDLPTVEDSALVERNLAALKKDLRTLKDSALIEFINSNSDNKWTGNFLKPNELSSEVANYLFNAQKDSVSNVIKSSDGYHLVRLLESKDGENLFYSASHILINFGTDTNAAKVKAEQILQRLKSGEDFNKLATEVSDDPGSKTNGGSLGWFTKGAMVKEFEDAVVNAKVGEIVGVIKTQYGYHIIKVHDRQKKEFKIADIKQTVKTSTKTKDAVLKKAEDFVFVAEKSSFDEEAKKLNFQILEAPNITKDAFIPNAGQNKKVSEFALKQKTGSISTPVKIQNGYAVYYIESQSPAGYSNFEEIKENIIRPRVLLEKKLEILHQRAVELKSKIPDNNLAALNSMNENVSVLAADSISAAKPNQNIGAEPAFNYTVFKMQNGQISEPIKTQRGYYLVQVRNITPFDQSKYEAAAETIRTNLLQQKKQMFISEWIEDLKNKAEIVDNRDKYFR